MQERRTLFSGFSGMHSTLPPGPGLVTGRGRVGGLLLAAILLFGGAASLLLHSQKPAPAHHRCTLVAAEDDQPALPAPRLSDAERAELTAERSRLLQLLAGYEESMEHGQGCRMGFVKYRLDLLRIEEKLAGCGYKRAHLQRQIAHLEALRARMLTGYGETQGPDAHDE